MKYKTIYKSIISILLISMLAMSGTASTPTSATSSLTNSNSEQIQNQRLTNLETNDTNQFINNSEQQSTISNIIDDISSIKNQILTLVHRVTNLENSVTNVTTNITNIKNTSYPAIYGKYDNYPLHPGIGYNNFTEMSNYTLYIPEDGYAQLDVSGWIGNMQDLTSIAVGLAYNDNPNITNNYIVWAQRFYSRFYSPNQTPEYSEFDINSPVSIKRGNYTVQLLGWTGQGDAYIGSATYTVTLTKLGQVTYTHLPYQNQNQPKIIVDKSGKIINK